MTVDLYYAGQLAQRIESQFRAELKSTTGWALCEAATTDNFGVCLEMTLSGNAYWSIHPCDIQFIETSGSRAEHNEKDEDLGMSIYMPDTSLVKHGSPTEDLDTYLKLWGVQLPSEDDALDDQGPWNRLERFRSLIVETPSLWEPVRLSILKRIDAHFESALLASVDEWLRRAHATLGDQLLD